MNEPDTVFPQLTFFDLGVVDENGGLVFPPDELMSKNMSDEGFLAEENILKNDIFAVEKNIHGAWTVYGSLGVRQYYFRTKQEATRMYQKECKNVEIVERGRSI